MFNVYDILPQLYTTISYTLTKFGRQPNEEEVFISIQTFIHNFDILFCREK